MAFAPGSTQGFGGARRSELGNPNQNRPSFGGAGRGTGFVPGTAAIGGGGGAKASTQSGGGGYMPPSGNPGTDWPTGPMAGPDLGNWNIEKGTDPEMARSRQRAEDYLGNLEKGTGYAMDVMQGSMQKQIDSDVSRAREAAAAQGLPFDEAAYRAKTNADMQAGLAQEKLGREKLYGEMQAGLQGNIAGEGERALAKSGLELERQGTRAGALNTRYGTQAGIYGTTTGRRVAEMQDQTRRYEAAMSMLRDFLNMSFSV